MGEAFIREGIEEVVGRPLIVVFRDGSISEGPTDVGRELRAGAHPTSSRGSSTAPGTEPASTKFCTASAYWSGRLDAGSIDTVAPSQSDVRTHELDSSRLRSSRGK